MMERSAERVLNPATIGGLMSGCLANSADDAGAMKVEGLTTTFAFDSVRLETHRNEIEALIQELPDVFFNDKDGGGGYTFLALDTDKHGEQWTGLHVVMEHLVCLAIGIGKAAFCIPREFWPAFPGGAPYVTFER